MAQAAIKVEGVSRSFGDVRALHDVSISVEPGSVLGLLGHNGAGKTTLVNILSTLLPPTSGSAAVAGFDVVRQAHQVRQRVGLTGQFAAVDDKLTGHANLVLIARLLGASRREARSRTVDLLEVFGLRQAADRPVRTYSGGMRRRLDLAAGLVGRPEVLFLDEPTTGLDLTSRQMLWDIVEGMVKGGVTVLLTTQYLEEADRLADVITVLADGQVIASGPGDVLKSQAGHRMVHVVLAHPAESGIALQAMANSGLAGTWDPTHQTMSAAVDSSADAAIALRALDHSDIAFTELSLTEPSLDDVYLALARKAGHDTQP